MNAPHSRARKNAEKLFSAAQVEFFSKNHAYEELDAADRAREEKTLRLRTARLAREQDETAVLIVAKATKHKKTI